MPSQPGPGARIWARSRSGTGPMLPCVTGGRGQGQPSAVRAAAGDSDDSEKRRLGKATTQDCDDSGLRRLGKSTTRKIDDSGLRRLGKATTRSHDPGQRRLATGGGRHRLAQRRRAPGGRGRADRSNLNVTVAAPVHLGRGPGYAGGRDAARAAGVGATPCSEAGRIKVDSDGAHPATRTATESRRAAAGRGAGLLAESRRVAVGVLSVSESLLPVILSDQS